jgi:hypothetical protein
LLAPVEATRVAANGKELKMALSSKAKTGGKARTARLRPSATTTGQCLCGAVALEIDVPVFWAWHDHSAASRRAHGAAYATYVGAWRSKVRIAKGESEIARFEEKETGNARSFCRRCGTPLIYERKRSAQMVDLPRALFSERTGREPKYHIAIEHMQDWAYLGAPVGPLKGYPGVVVERTKKKRGRTAPVFDPDF